MTRDRLGRMVEEASTGPLSERALLFAPAPAPIGAFRILLESEGYDVLVAQDPIAVESLLGSAHVDRLVAVVPALDPRLAQRWQALGKGVDVEVVSGLKALLDERVVPTDRLADFTVRSLSTLVALLCPARGIPARRTARRLELSEVAVRALGMSSRALLATRLSAVLHDVPELLRVSEYPAETDATTPGNETITGRQRLEELGKSLGAPLPLGVTQPEGVEEGPPTPWEIVQAAERLLRLEEREGAELASLLRGEVARIGLHPGAVEAVLSGLISDRGRRGRILVADPDATGRSLLALRLSNEGFQVVTAADGRAARDEAMRERPDLVLSEVVLPGLDGYGLLDQLQQAFDEEVPFVFLSGRTDTLAVNKGLLLGAADFLVKPVDPEILLTKVRKLLGESPDREEVTAKIRLSESVRGETRKAEPSYDELGAGVVIAGRFRVEEDLGEGGMGKILRARDQQLDETVVIKVMRTELGNDARVLEHFKREIRLARRIAHPGVVRIYDFWEVGALKFVTMEFLEGQDLRRELQRRGPFPVPVALRVGQGILEALAAAHEVGVVHRDIKPHNVVLLPSGRIKVLDFGIAQGLEADSPDGSTLTTAMVGTPEYMSPEQLMGERVDERTDLYSCGVLLYELLTGHLPFRGESRMATATLRLREMPDPPSQRSSHLPPELDQVILRLLARERGDRYPSAASAAEAFDQLRAMA